MTINTLGWEARMKRMWPRVSAAREQILHPTRQPHNAFWGFENAIVGATIARGSQIRGELEPLLPAVEAGVEFAATEADRGPVGAASLDIVDVFGVMMAVGVDVPAPTQTRVGDIVPAVTTSRQERANHHWRRAFIALALDLRAGYRAEAGFDRSEKVPFRPGATFGVNVQGFLAQLIGAVEQGGTLSACMPAWEDLLRNYFEIEAAKVFDDPSLLWAAWTLQHRIGGQPIVTIADFLHESVYRVAAGA